MILQERSWAVNQIPNDETLPPHHLHRPGPILTPATPLSRMNSRRQRTAMATALHNPPLHLP